MMGGGEVRWRRRVSRRREREKRGEEEGRGGGEGWVEEEREDGTRSLQSAGHGLPRASTFSLKTRISSSHPPTRL